MEATDLVRSVEVMLPASPDAARAAMTQYRELTAAMLNDDDWQKITGGSFVKRSGFQKIASGYGLSTEIISQAVDHDDDGQPVRATAVVRATHPSGRYAEGDGHCSVNESRFSTAKGRAKVEHDLPATAVTRATNRAISNLVGFGQMSAEEMDGDGTSEALPFGAEGDDKLAATLVHELYPAVDGSLFVQFFRSQLGVEHVPDASVRMLQAIKWALGDERVKAQDVPVDATVEGTVA